MKKHRIQMDVGPKTLERVERLKEHFEAASIAEVIQLAITALEEKVSRDIPS